MYRLLPQAVFAFFLVNITPRHLCSIWGGRQPILKKMHKLLRARMIFSPATLLTNEGIVQWPIRDQCDGTAEYGLLEPLVESRLVNFPAVCGFRMPNAVDWRCIHQHYTGLGKAHTRCETVHAFWARARVDRDTFLSSIWLAIDTVKWTMLTDRQNLNPTPQLITILMSPHTCMVLQGCFITPPLT